MAQNRPFRPPATGPRPIPYPRPKPRPPGTGTLRADTRIRISARGSPRTTAGNPVDREGSRSTVLDANRRYGLVGGKLPKGCQYIENRVNGLRRQVESAIVELKGEIGIVDAANVNSILKWERHGLLAAHWLRHEAGKLSPTERLKFSEAIAKASDARDRAIRSLGLDVPPEPIDLRQYIDASGDDPAGDLAEK